MTREEFENLEIGKTFKAVEDERQKRWPNNSDDNNGCYHVCDFIWYWLIELYYQGKDIQMVYVGEGNLSFFYKNILTICFNYVIINS